MEPSQIQFGGLTVHEELSAGPSSLTAVGLTVHELFANAPAPRDRSRSPSGQVDLFDMANNCVCFSIETYKDDEHRAFVHCTGKPSHDEKVCILKCPMCATPVDMIRLLPWPGVIHHTAGSDFKRSSATCCNRDYQVTFDSPPATFRITPCIVENRTS